MAAVLSVLLEDEEDINEVRFRNPEFSETGRFTFETSLLKVRANSTPVGSREGWG